eukprot:PITA_18782
MQHTVPYPPQQNGVAKRKNHTLKKMDNSYKPSSVDVPPLSIPSTSENICSSDDDSEDANSPPPSQDPPSVPQLPKWVCATQDPASALAEASPLLVGFADSNWAGDPDDQKSTTGYVFTHGSGPITWACKKQSVISLSSAEAEYCGIVESSKEALWLR